MPIRRWKQRHPCGPLILKPSHLAKRKVAFRGPASHGDPVGFCRNRRAVMPGLVATARTIPNRLAQRSSGVVSRESFGLHPREVIMVISLRRLLGGAAIIAAAAASPVQAIAQAPGGTMVIVGTSSPRHLNPAVQSGAATAIPGTQLFASPLKYDGQWNPQPYLAKSWSIAENGLSVTLNLVDNAVFHDGTPVTSEDVAFSIETMRNNHPFTSMYAPVTAVETPDTHTAVIRLSRPHPAIMLALSGPLCPIIPKHVFGDGQNIRSHPANAAPIGSGPFRFVSWEPGGDIVLERFDDFFIEGRPYLDGIVIRRIRDSSAIVIAMKNGDADMYPFVGESREIRALEEAEDLVVTRTGYEAVGPIVWLAFNAGKEPLNDVRVRQAIAYAIDRDFIVNALQRGRSTIQRGPIIESSPFFDETIEAYDLDLEKSNALLDEAGHVPDGDGTRFRLTIDYAPFLPEQLKTPAEYMKSQLRKVGIGIELRASPDLATWANRVSTHEFDLTMDLLFNWGDPVIGVHRTYLSSNILKGVIWSNTQQYSNPKVDELLEAAGKEIDPARRKALYSEFQHEVARDLPVYWLNSLPFHSAFRKSMVNPPLGIWGPMQSMDDLAFQ